MKKILTLMIAFSIVIGMLAGCASQQAGTEGTVSQTLDGLPQDGTDEQEHASADKKDAGAETTTRGVAEETTVPEEAETQVIETTEQEKEDMQTTVPTEATTAEPDETQKQTEEIELPTTGNSMGWG